MMKVAKLTINSLIRSMKVDTICT